MAFSYTAYGLWCGSQQLSTNPAELDILKRIHLRLLFYCQWFNKVHVVKEWPNKKLDLLKINDENTYIGQTQP